MVYTSGGSSGRPKKCAPPHRLACAVCFSRRPCATRRFRTLPKKTRDGDDGVDGPDLADIAGIKNMRRKAAGAAADA